jgi:hypothetical protein
MIRLKRISSSSTPNARTRGPCGAAQGGSTLQSSQRPSALDDTNQDHHERNDQEDVTPTRTQSSASFTSSMTFSTFFLASPTARLASRRLGRPSPPASSSCHRSGPPQPPSRVPSLDRTFRSSCPILPAPPTSGGGSSTHSVCPNVACVPTTATGFRLILNLVTTFHFHYFVNSLGWIDRSNGSRIRV